MVAHRLKETVMNRTILVSVALIGLLLNKPSLAQEYKAVLHGESRESLLLREPVQRDLGLAEEQKGAVDRILRAKNPVEMADLLRRLEEYAKQALTPSQLDRLEGIYIQAVGTDALFDPKIAARLRLSEDQKDRLSDAREPYVAHFTSLRKMPIEDGKGRKEWRKQRQALLEKLDYAATSILTTSQLEQLKELRGEPIDLSHEKEGLPHRKAK
jgi:hypothetical protein